MKTRCIIVIGHVDHGKTSLVRALTGKETDRTAEEKSRGLSILPGFAHKTYPEGIIDFIDAPGHEDFIQAMICGATGAQAALLVISGTEGIGAQTLEHLTIAGHLGITQGVIAVTKSDLIPPSEQAACLNTLRANLSETSFADAPMILCSALTGDGLENLTQTLQTQLRRLPEIAAPLQTMLPIDRVFTLSGHGTIVTGTLLGGELDVEAKAIVQPMGKAVTIRSLQSRGVDRETVQSGERIAVNLRGVAVSDIPRGAVLCVDNVYLPSTCIDAQLHLPSNACTPLKHMEEVRVLFGTSNEVATVRLFGGGRLSAGQTSFAQLRFRKQVFGFAGQRAILRRLSPSETIGAAVFLDPQSIPTRSADKRRVAVLEAAHADQPLEITKALCAAHRGVAYIADIARLSKMSEQDARITLTGEFESLDVNFFATREDIKAHKTNIVQALTAHHLKHPLQAGVPHSATAFPTVSAILTKHSEVALCEDGQIRRDGTNLALCSHDPMALLSDVQKHRMGEIEDTIRSAGITPPALPTSQEVDADLIALLIHAGRLVSLSNVSLKQTLLLHVDTLTAAAATLFTAFPPPVSFTTSQARIALGTSRRVIVPVLEYFDTTDRTIPEGNTRQMRDALPVSPATSN